MSKRPRAYHIIIGYDSLAVFDNFAFKNMRKFLDRNIRVGDDFFKLNYAITTF